MKPRLLIFNYNFEFALGGRSAQTAKPGNRWWVLNRSVSWLAPLLNPKDAIYAVEAPAPEVITSLTKLLGFKPQFLVAPPPVESNDMGLNLQSSGVDTSTYELVYWGQSSKLAAFFNSKETSARLRAEFLPIQMQIPSLWVPYTKSFAADFSALLQNFAREHGSFLIKDPFGVSGAFLWGGGNYSEKLRKQMIGMARQSGGLLLEKKMEVQAEWSLHFDFSAGAYSYQGMTELFSYDSGAYLGSVVKESQALLQKMEELQPLLQAYAKLGVEGPVGLDFLEGKEGGFYLLEINQRITMGRLALEWGRLLDFSDGPEIRNQRGKQGGVPDPEPEGGELLRFVEDEVHFWKTFLY